MSHRSILEKPEPRAKSEMKPQVGAELVTTPVEQPLSAALPAPRSGSAVVTPMTHTAASEKPRPAQRLIDEEEDDDGFFAAHRGKFITVVILLIGGAVWAFTKSPSGKSAPVKAKAPVMMVSLPPLPPPPPPPPPPPAPKTPPPDEPEEKMIEQTPVETPEEKPQETPKPADEPPPMGTAIAGSGPPDGFGLSGSGGGGMIGGAGKVGGGRGGSKYGWYAGQVQSRIAEAMRGHQRTSRASLSVQVRIWADSNGRITRATLAGSTGDAALDQALKNEVLLGLQLREPPPQDMPMPIVLRLSARRPG